MGQAPAAVEPFLPRWAKLQLQPALLLHLPWAMLRLAHILLPLPRLLQVLLPLALPLLPLLPLLLLPFSAQALPAAQRHALSTLSPAPRMGLQV